MALGGVGEAMLLSAAIGGGTSALTGGDPLKGALLGAATGWMGGGGISNLLQGNPLAGIVSNTATQTALPAVADAAAGATQGLNALQSNLPAGLENVISPSQAAANLGVPGVPVSTMPGSQSAMLASQQSGFGAEGLEKLRAAAEGASAVPQNVASAPTDAFKVGPVGSEKISLFKDPLGYIKDNQFMAGSAALAGALGGQRKIKPPERRKIEGLPIWQYGYSGGGITALASGGISDLGTYSDGGRMLKGRGDGMSDSIPGVIAGKRPARLADGEFVVPADVVSHLGNGSTDAGAKQLYAMMDKVRSARTGTRKQGRQINPRRFMPA